MAEPQRAASKEPKGTGEVVADLWGLLKDYGRQETIDPLKNLGRFVGYGSGAAVCFGIAGTLVTLAVLRVIQVETRDFLDGNWTWVPYVAALVICSAGAYLSLRRIKKGGQP